MFKSNVNNLIDSSIGSSYEVVKKVANNLDIINGFNQNANIEELKENIPLYTKISNMSDDIKKLSDNTEELLKVPSYASAVDNTLKEAEKAFANQVEEANKIVEQHEAISNEFKSTADNILDIKEDIVNVSDNMQHVVTDSTNINNIKTVAQFIEGSYTKPAVKQDLGTVGSDDGGDVDIGNSPLDIIADNIEEIITIYKHLSEILDLYYNLDIKSLTDLANNINQYLKQIEVYKEEINKQLSKINSSILYFEQLSAEKINYIEDLINQADKAYENYLDTLNSIKLEVTEIKNECLDIKEECVAKLIAISNQALSIKRILEELADKYSLQIQKEASRAIRDIKKTINNTSEIIQEDIDQIVDDTLDKIQTEADKIKDNTSQDIQEEADKIVNEIIDKVDLNLLGFFKLKGSVPTASNLSPNDNLKGDVYFVEDTKMYYIWDNFTWSPLTNEVIYDYGIVGD